MRAGTDVAARSAATGGEPGLDQQLELAVQARRRARCLGSARRCRPGSARRRRRAASWRRTRAPGSASSPGGCGKRPSSDVRSAAVMNAREARVLESDAPLATPVVLSVTDSVGVTNARAATTRSARTPRRPARPRRCARARWRRRRSPRPRPGASRCGSRRACCAPWPRRSPRRARCGRCVAMLHAVRRAVVVDDLDVVGSLGDPGVDEGRRVGGRRRAWESACRTRCRALWRRDERARREEVGAPRAPRPRRLLLLCASSRQTGDR